MHSLRLMFGLCRPKESVLAQGTCVPRRKALDFYGQRLQDHLQSAVRKCLFNTAAANTWSNSLLPVAEDLKSSEVLRRADCKQ